MYRIQNILALTHDSYHLHTSEFKGGEFFQEHCHDFHEFFMVVSGTLEHGLNGRCFRLPPGTIQLIHPGDCHWLRCASESPGVKIYNCNVSSDELLKVMCFLTGGHDFSLEDWRQTVLLPLDSFWCHLVSLAERAREAEAGSRIRSALFRQLAGSVLLALMPSAEAANVCPPQWLENSYAAMKEKSNFRVGLPRFLALASRSPEHLCRSMRRFYGISPQDYITGLRLEEAVRLLLETDLDVSEVAWEVGFNNLSYFRRRFRARYGTSPVKYKKTGKQRRRLSAAGE